MKYIPLIPIQSLSNSDTIIMLRPQEGDGFLMLKPDSENFDPFVAHSIICTAMLNIDGGNSVNKSSFITVGTFEVDNFQALNTLLGELVPVKNLRVKLELINSYKLRILDTDPKRLPIYDNFLFIETNDLIKSIKQFAAFRQTNNERYENLQRDIYLHFQNGGISFRIVGDSKSGFVVQVEVYVPDKTTHDVSFLFQEKEMESLHRFFSGWIYGHDIFPILQMDEDRLASVIQDLEMSSEDNAHENGFASGMLFIQEKIHESALSLPDDEFPMKREDLIRWIDAIKKQ